MKQKINELKIKQDNCFYCDKKNPTILKPVLIFKETFFKRMAYEWVCKDCNKIYCEHLGVIENEQ